MNRLSYIKTFNRIVKEDKMKTNRKKLELAMARACMSTSDLQKATGMPRPTINNAISGRGIRPSTMGRIAKALGTDVTAIIDDIDK